MTANAEHEHVDLGQGHLLSWIVAGEGDGTRIGAIIDHKTPAGADCAGSVQWADSVWQRQHPESTVNRARWQLERLEPLTISPSVHCLACGDHGFIRDGKWVPA